MKTINVVLSAAFFLCAGAALLSIVGVFAIPTKFTLDVEKNPFLLLPVLAQSIFALLMSFALLKRRSWAFPLYCLGATFFLFYIFLQAGVFAGERIVTLSDWLFRIFVIVVTLLVGWLIYAVKRQKHFT